MTPRRVPRRQLPTFTAQSVIRTLSELQDVLHRSLLARPELDPLAIAFAVSDLGQSIEDNNVAAGDLPVFSIATALFAALREISKPYPYVATEQAPFLVLPGEARALAANANGVFSDDWVSWHRDEKYGDPNTQEVPRLNMIWTLAENTIFQGELRDRLVAALVLTGLEGFRNLPAAPERAEALFQRHLGVSARDYVLILLGLWAYALSNSLVTLPTLFEEGPRKEELTRSARRVVAALARRADRFGDLSDEPAFSRYSGKALPSAVFQRWPLVQLNDDQYFVSAHPFMRIQLSSKFLTKALSLARLNAPVEERGRTEFSAFVGRDRLEPFVRELCDLWCPGQHFDEYEFLRGGNARSPDRIVFEHHGGAEVAVLLQLKAKLVLEATHFGADGDALARDLGSAMSETVYKTIQYLAAVESADSEERLNVATAELSRRVLRCRRFCIVGIVPELPPLLTMSDVRQLLLDSVHSNLRPADREWLERNRDRLMWHVIGLDEFLKFLALPIRERALYKRLAGYFRDEGPDRPFIDSAGRFPMSFRNYLVTRYANGRTRQTDTGVATVFDRLFEETKRFFASPSFSP